MIDSETVTLDVLKATVSREQFAESVAVVARALSTRASVLVLGGIQLTATAEGLALAATDMELSLRASMDAEVASEGTVVVPGRLLLDIARALPESDVSLEHLGEDSVLEITSGSASYRIHTYSAEDFPHLPDLEGDRAPGGRSRGAARHDRPGEQVGVARREPARAHGDLRELRGGQARDGRDGLLPPRGQGDRRAGARCPTSRRSSRPGRSRRSRGSPARATRSRWPSRRTT